ncbi:MAG: hypothetical protein BWY44_00966 [Candidatus Omnitrophica bacterium ADurb.Bin292]|nr:MAG: hypothetical protein BWY44_00966 [Candidatus Omnitrophica bacterium ADurb.Bin292]
MFDNLRERGRRRKDSVFLQSRIIHDHHLIGAMFNNFPRGSFYIMSNHHGTHLRTKLVGKLAGLAQNLER